MKHSTNREVATLDSGTRNDEEDSLHFKHSLAWLEAHLSRIKRGSLFLIHGKPGSSKSIFSEMASIDLGLESRRTHFALSEETESQVKDRITQLMESLPKYKQKKVWRNVSFLDNIPKIDMLPDHLLGLISKRSQDGTIPDLLVVDSLNGNGLHANSKSYEQIYALFRICRMAGITLFAICHSLKRGNQHAGAMGISHSVDCVCCIKTCWRYRYFNVLKNRYGPACGPPVVLKMDDTGLLVPAPHARALAATARTFHPGCGFAAEILVAVGIPASFGQSAQIRTPGIRKAHVCQVLRTLEQIPDFDLSLSGLDIDVQLVSGSGFSKTLLLPIVMATLASVAQTDLPSNVYFTGELDLKRRIRKLPTAMVGALAASLQSGLLEDGSALVCPAADAPELAEYTNGVQIVGIETLDELIENLRKGKTVVEQRAA